MITRIWPGFTTPDDADVYENLLRTEIFAGIVGRDAVREFAGEDYEAAVVPPAARAVLAHFDDRSQHYELRERQGTPTPGSEPS